MSDSMFFARAAQRNDPDVGAHIEYRPNMDKFSAGGFRPTELAAQHEGIDPRELAIRKGLAAIEVALFPADLYAIVSLWAKHEISIQVQDMDNKILAREEIWAQQDRRDAQLAREAKRRRQTEDDALYDQLLAKAVEAAPNSTAYGLVVGGEVVVSGLVKSYWRQADMQAMLSATETRLSGGRLEFVVGGDNA